MTASITWTAGAGGTINLDDHTAREIGVKSNDRISEQALGVRQGQRNFSPRIIAVTQDAIDWAVNGPDFLDLMNDVGRSGTFTFTHSDLGTFTVRLANFRPLNKRAPYLGTYSFTLEEDLT